MIQTWYGDEKIYKNSKRTYKYQNVSIYSNEFELNETHKIPVKVDKINSILGIKINKDQYLSYLIKLGFDINEEYVSIPSYRNDINNQNDLAEEIRIIGYVISQQMI